MRSSSTGVLGRAFRAWHFALWIKTPASSSSWILDPSSESRRAASIRSKQQQQLDPGSKHRLHCRTADTDRQQDTPQHTAGAGTLWPIFFFENMYASPTPVKINLKIITKPVFFFSKLHFSHLLTLTCGLTCDYVIVAGGQRVQTILTFPWHVGPIMKGGVEKLWVSPWSRAWRQRL